MAIDFKTIIKTVAPWIGGAIGGPFGGLAEQAISVALGLDDKSPEAVQAAVAAITPEQLLAIKQADNAFSLQMKALGYKQVIDMESLIAGDRKSARDMQMSIRSRIPALLTCFVVGAFTMTLILLLKFDVPTSNRDIVTYMIGQLSGGFSAALAFWLGTTSSSAAKTEIIAKSAPIKE